ncbi:H-2 class II histocompatibility antigen, E-S beta chain-like isoform X1 [Podarcis raffonei]|uniref:H-2 class II histocompatibility antigen, E-S beta chain-like isoform X1 n=1 Tax=Podarcis raffonei TaxID=65483 RepID=UPI0023292310|nr:H-2 class II histocompatibility antigen, E-S beta chain-like isoform X1 [Podarcis raffonei]
MGGSGAAPLAFGGLLLGMLVVSASEGLGVEAPPEHFLFQKKGECHFSNGKQRVHFLQRDFFDRQELFYFDSDREKFMAVAELAESQVKIWNQDKDALRGMMSNVDACRLNYEIFDPFSQARRVQPQVKITPTDNDESSPHNTLLICTVNRFFPAGIEIKWFRNGKEEPKVWTTDLIRNGDWTFHIEDSSVRLRCSIRILGCGEALFFLPVALCPCSEVETSLEGGWKESQIKNDSVHPSPTSVACVSFGGSFFLCFPFRLLWQGCKLWQPVSFFAPLC